MEARHGGRAFISPPGNSGALGWLWENPESEVPLATLSALLRN